MIGPTPPPILPASVLLIDEPPLQVLPSLARLVGLEEAIVLQQVHYWLRRSGVMRPDDCLWVYNTYEQWQEQFPFWSVRQVRRIINHLEAQGYLIAGRFNARRADQTKWYTINYRRLLILADDAPTQATSCADPGHLFNRNTENNTETTETQRKGDQSGTPQQPLAPAFGTSLAAKPKQVTEITPEFRALMVQKYAPTLGSTVNERIDEALSHKASKKYTDLQRYVNGWLRRDAERVAGMAIPAVKKKKQTVAPPPEAKQQAWLDELRADQEKVKEGYTHAEARRQHLLAGPI